MTASETWCIVLSQSEESYASQPLTFEIITDTEKAYLYTMRGKMGTREKSEGEHRGYHQGQGLSM